MIPDPVDDVDDKSSIRFGSVEDKCEKCSVGGMLPTISAGAVIASEKA